MSALAPAAPTPDAVLALRHDAAGVTVNPGDLLIDVRGRLFRMTRTEDSLVKQARVVRGELLSVRTRPFRFVTTAKTDMLRVYECLRVTDEEVRIHGLPALQQRRIAAYTAMLTENGRIPWEA